MDGSSVRIIQNVGFSSPKNMRLNRQEMAIEPTKAGAIHLSGASLTHLLYVRHQLVWRERNICKCWWKTYQKPMKTLEIKCCNCTFTEWTPSLKLPTPPSSQWRLRAKPAEHKEIGWIPSSSSPWDGYLSGIQLSNDRSYRHGLLALHATSWKWIQKMGTDLFYHTLPCQTWLEHTPNWVLPIKTSIVWAKFLTSDATSLASPSCLLRGLKEIAMMIL